MKFGTVQNPDDIDFYLPEDPPETARVLTKYGGGVPDVYVGCPKWTRQELKGFYPRGTKDELEYYGSQFNAIELNATFYRNFPPRQITNWYEKVPSGFRFFPKVNRQLSHRKMLKNVDNTRESFLDSVLHFKEKLGTIFLQLHEDFSPEYFDRLQKFLEKWPDELSLAIDFRNSDWFDDAKASEDRYELLKEHDVANIIVDTAGRRDLLHMQLTNNNAFIRYVGANHPSDYDRLDEWVNRLKVWNDQGLQNIQFFVHQNEESATPKLAAYFIKSLNKVIDSEVNFPILADGGQGDLF